MCVCLPAAHTSADERQEDRSLKRYLIAALVLVLLVGGVLLLEWGDPDVQTEAALPGVQEDLVQRR